MGAAVPRAAPDRGGTPPRGRAGGEPPRARRDHPQDGRGARRRGHGVARPGAGRRDGDARRPDARQHPRARPRPGARPEPGPRPRGHQRGVPQRLVGRGGGRGSGPGRPRRRVVPLARRRARAEPRAGQAVVEHLAVRPRPGHRGPQPGAAARRAGRGRRLRRRRRVGRGRDPHGRHPTGGRLPRRHRARGRRHQAVADERLARGAAQRGPRPRPAHGGGAQGARRRRPPGRHARERARAGHRARVHGVPGPRLRRRRAVPRGPHRRRPHGPAVLHQGHAQDADAPQEADRPARAQARRLRGARAARRGPLRRDGTAHGAGRDPGVPGAGVRRVEAWSAAGPALRSRRTRWTR